MSTFRFHRVINDLVVPNPYVSYLIGLVASLLHFSVGLVMAIATLQPPFSSAFLCSLCRFRGTLWLVALKRHAQATRPNRITWQVLMRKCFEAKTHWFYGHITSQESSGINQSGQTFICMVTLPTWRRLESTLKSLLSQWHSTFGRGYQHCEVLVHPSTVLVWLEKGYNTTTWKSNHGYFQRVMAFLISRLPTHLWIYKYKPNK